MACNIPDFSRYARSSKGQYIQLPFLPIVFTICGTLGIITTSASIVVYGEVYWNPLEMIQDHWLGSRGGRAAGFFAALSWYIAQVGTNITANSISAANDLTVLCPRYINIFRGCIIAAIVGGWVIVPWKIIKSADTFLSFMYVVQLEFHLSRLTASQGRLRRLPRSHCRHYRVRLLACQALQH